MPRIENDFAVFVSFVAAAEEVGDGPDEGERDCWMARGEGALAGAAAAVRAVEDLLR